MRCLGMLGGMSWESTTEYYRLINRAVAARMGGLHSAPLLIHSVDFAPLAETMARGDWAALGAQLAGAARGLEGAGAEAILVCTNTMHHVATEIEAAVSIPLLHIVDPVGRALREAGVTRAALLGTRFTMELPFWRERLEAGSGIRLVVPDAEDRETVHRIIFDELCRGEIRPASRAAYVDVIRRLRDAGAEAVVFGCTEISLLLDPADSPLLVVDTTALHAAAAVDFITGADGAAVSPDSGAAGTFPA